MAICLFHTYLNIVMCYVWSAGVTFFWGWWVWGIRIISSFHFEYSELDIILLQGNSPWLGELIFCVWWFLLWTLYRKVLHISVIIITRKRVYQINRGHRSSIFNLKCNGSNIFTNGVLIIGTCSITSLLCSAFRMLKLLHP